MSEYRAMLQDLKDYEIEIDRLRAELAELRAYCNCDERIDISHADALNAIARVRELPGLNQTTLSVLAKAVLRALDGSTG